MFPRQKRGIDFYEDKSRTVGLESSLVTFSVLTWTSPGFIAICMCAHVSLGCCAH